VAVDHAEIVAQASTAAAESVAREAQANTESQAATTEAPEAAPAPFDVDAYYAQYESAPEDARQKLAERFLQAEPIRKQVSAESSRAITRAQQQAQQAQAREAETRLDYILADENHPEHYEALEKYGTGRKDVATQRVGIRTALERPEVRVAARIETARTIIGQAMAHPAFGGITEDEWAEALNADDVGTALGLTFQKKLEREKADWLKQYEPALRAKALDDFRAGLPNPDAGRSVTSGRTSGPVTPQTIRDMDAREFAKNADAIWASLPRNGS
jgi:hypothetical protein